MYPACLQPLMRPLSLACSVRSVSPAACAPSPHAQLMWHALPLGCLQRALRLAMLLVHENVTDNEAMKTIIAQRVIARWLHHHREVKRRSRWTGVSAVSAEAQTEVSVAEESVAALDVPAPEAAPAPAHVPLAAPSAALGSSASATADGGVPAPAVASSAAADVAARVEEIVVEAQPEVPKEKRPSPDRRRSSTQPRKSTADARKPTVDARKSTVDEASVAVFRRRASNPVFF
jgi:hypothetical protein